MTLFLVETAAIAALVIGAIVLEYLRTRDSLHPVAILGPMMLFLYVALPLYLLSTDGFFGYLTEDHLQFAQGVHLVGVAALLAGAIWGARRHRPGSGHSPRAAPTPSLAAAGIVLGVLGLLGFGIGLWAVGGLTAAYGTSYGGGWSDSGYVRELYHLTIPAILLLFASGELRRKPILWVWVAAFAAPFLIHGSLGARRGPLFVVLVALVAGWYLINRTRPSLWVVFGGGAVLGTLLLFIVSNRQSIYVGSDLELDRSPTTYMRSGGGNEFLFGAGAIVTADVTDAFAWGGRYATVFFVRPIPRSLWPTKYDDAEQWFGINIERNLGIDPDAFARVLGWRGAAGAAPGIVADMFVEFAWGSLLALVLIGFGYGYAWSRSTSAPGRAGVLYAMLLGLSLYLIMQTLEAMAFRFLVMAIPMTVAWSLAAARRRPEPV